MKSTDLRDLVADRVNRAAIPIGSAALDRLCAYFELLSHWNARINLTGFSLDSPSASAIDRLLVEPLLLSPLFKEHVRTWFDLGSGGGSPALPLWFYRPVPRLVMVESKERKAAFLREVVRELRLPGVEVEVSRIESITASHSSAGGADVVTMRAVRPSSAVMSAIQVLLRSGGRAVLAGTSLALPAIHELQVIQTIDLPQNKSALVVTKP